MVTPTTVVFALIALVAFEVLRQAWVARRNARIQASYVAAFYEVQKRCITTQYFVRYLQHIKNVIATRPRNEVLKFDTTPGKLLESFLKQQLRNVDPEYRLFDERLAWSRQTTPASQIVLPATAWMNAYVARWTPKERGPTATEVVLSRLEEAIQCVQEIPRGLQLLPGVSPEGDMGIHLEKALPGGKKGSLKRGYLVLAILWTLHLAVVITHGKTWTDLLNNQANLILAFAPPLAGYVLLQLALWTRPSTKTAEQREARLHPYLFHSLRGIKTHR